MTEPSTSTGETWKTAVGYEGLYLVSDHGNVWSVPRPKTKGGLMKMHPGSQGRLEVNLTKDGKQKVRRVHQLVMEAFAGAPKPGQEIRHLDGDNTNNRWAPGETEEEVRANGGNLFYGSHARNMADMVEHGRARPHATECPQGHLYDEKNTGWYNGSKFCRQCGNEKSLARHHATYVPVDPAATCAHCGETFDREPGKPRQKFCSQECRDAGGWMAKRTHTPAADLTPEEREHRNALNRERTRRSRARHRAGRGRKPKIPAPDALF